MILLAVGLLGAQLWLSSTAYSGPGLKTIPSGAEVLFFRTGGQLSAQGGFSGLTEQISLGRSPGPLRLTAADLPAQLTLKLWGYREARVTVQSWPDPQVVRLSPEVPLLVDLYYSWLRTPGYWGLLLLGVSGALAGWRVRLNQSLRRQREARLAAGELRAGDRLADFTVEKLLGRGGMGSVYLARTSGGEPVALKLLRAQGRFLEEARAYQKLRHPNLVFLLDWGEVHGQLYLALEFVAGETLGNLLRRGAAVDSLRLARDLLAALVELQRLGIVHRDLKPDNVMLEDGRARLLDFGLAQSEGAGGGTSGTPGYSAPEQLRGQPVDARADLYALGAILYHAVSGRPPFVGNSPAHLLKLQVEGGLEPLEGPLGPLIAELLQPDPEDRPRDPQALLSRF